MLKHNILYDDIAVPMEFAIEETNSVEMLTYIRLADIIAQLFIPRLAHNCSC